MVTSIDLYIAVSLLVATCGRTPESRALGVVILIFSFAVKVAAWLIVRLAEICFA